ncbi:MAG: hypothetical protein U9R16_06145 [Campylobacterota bacterium]|nr:hypothetical protein [Campylobacterota bacterium]
MNNKNKTIFLNKKSSFTFDEKVDVILSPELYWVRIFNIPLKNKNDVLKALPTYFEDFFDVEGYEFYVIKLEDEQYLCFAYLESLISQIANDANLKLSQILNIHFSQNEFLDFKSFKIDNQYLAYHDDILLRIPKNLTNENDISNIDMDSIKLSKHTFSINKTNKYIDTKSIYLLSFIFILISFINFGKVTILSNTINETTNNQTKIAKEYKMLPTMMQTKSVIKSLEKKQTLQVNLRDKLKNSFQSNRNIQRVSYRNREITYE